MCKITYSTKLGVICYKNLKGQRNFGNIGLFGTIGTSNNLAKNPEIA